MQDVYIRFLDGGTIRFRARSFDVNVGGRLPSEAKPKRFTCRGGIIAVETDSW